MQAKQRQQLLDQLPAWLDKLLVHSHAFMSKHNNVPHDHRGIVATVCFAAAQCPDAPQLQMVVADLHGKYGHEYISSVQTCNPNAPDQTLRISDNVLRYGQQRSGSSAGSHACAQMPQSLSLS